MSRKRRGTIGATAPDDSKGVSGTGELGLEPSGEVLARVASGDLAALGELYQGHAESAYQLAYRITGSVADAEDIVQDLFIGLPEALESLQAEGSFRAWLRTCALRAALVSLRTTRRRGEVKLEPDWIAGSTPPAIERIDLESAINRLPDSLRVVLVLKEIEGFPHTEIGELLHISAAASRVRMMRARRMLRRMLGPSPAGWDE